MSMARFVSLVKHDEKMLLSLIHCESTNVTYQNLDSISSFVIILFLKKVSVQGFFE